jgi:hypothetical protein
MNNKPKYIESIVKLAIHLTTDKEAINDLPCKFYLKSRQIGLKMGCETISCTECIFFTASRNSITEYLNNSISALSKYKDNLNE